MGKVGSEGCAQRNDSFRHLVFAVRAYIIVAPHIYKLKLQNNGMGGGYVPSPVALARTKHLEVAVARHGACGGRCP